MNGGAHETPKQAARSTRVVRLVSFAAAAVLALLVLGTIASLRYPLLWRPAPDDGVVISEIVRPPLQPAPAPAPQMRPPEDEALVQQGEPALPVPQWAPATPSSTIEVITDPVWVRRPRNPERFYPREAFMRGVEGEVVLDCLVELSGRLRCDIVSETPLGQGFGQAALALAAEHTMQPATSNGTLVRGRYRMVVPFSPGG